MSPSCTTSETELDIGQKS